MVNMHITVIQYWGFNIPYIIKDYRIEYLISDLTYEYICLPIWHHGETNTVEKLQTKTEYISNHYQKYISNHYQTVRTASCTSVSKLQR